MGLRYVVVYVAQEMLVHHALVASKPDQGRQAQPRQNHERVQQEELLCMLPRPAQVYYAKRCVAVVGAPEA